MHNVLTFLWRTLYIQAVLRHYLFTALELGLVGLLFYSQLHEGEFVRSLSPENEELPVDSVMRPFRPLAVIYGPNTSYNNKLMALVVAECESLPENPSMELVPTQRTTQGGFQPKPIDEGKLFDVENVTSAAKVPISCRKKVTQLAATKGFLYVGQGLLCVALRSDDASPSLEHTLYAPTPYIGFQPTEFPLGSGGGAGMIIYESAQFQYLIEKTHLLLQQEELKQEQEQIEIRIQDMPAWVFGNKEQEAYRKNLGRALTLGFLIPLVRRINAIEVEFSTGLAEHQGVMGLSGTHFILGHFLTIMTYEVLEGGMLLGVMYLDAPKGRKPYADGMDLGVMLTSFGLFHINHALFIIFICWIFPTGWTGIIVAIVMTVVIPYMTGIGSLDVSVAAYMLQSRWRKRLSALLPHTGLASVLRIAFIARDFEDRTGWSVVNERVLKVDNVTILQIWLLMGLAGVSMTFLAWYLSKVLPWSTDNVQSPTFCLKWSYWKPDRTPHDSETASEKRDPARFEVAPPGVRPVIVVRNLTKMFGHVSALSGLDLEVYESNVTVLLGHNGAGKTTLMSILTGIKGPTSGVARVYGYDAATCREDIRKIVSFCQQTDVFFEDLSCTENLMYFGSLKGSTRKQVREAIQKTLKVVNLEDKADNMPRQLSGGMKRRLSLAIALVSNPKLVILDEPTTGLDPETRRNVWDAIQIVGKQHTVLLSSHDMEEADAIGQHIIIMSLGSAVGSGSTAFLKKACGVGYKIALMKAPSGFNLDGALNEIRKTVPHAEVEDDKQGEATIVLKTLDITGFPAMFKALERSSTKLGIETIGVTVASMKDVYLKINQEWALGGKEREQEVNENDIAGVCQVVASGRSSSWRCLGALFSKRTVCLRRSWGIFIVGLALPLVLLLLTVYVFRMPSSKAFQTNKDKVSRDGMLPVQVRLGTHFPASTVFFKESPASNASRAFKLLVESEGGRVYPLNDENAREQMRAIAGEDFGYYVRTYPMGAIFEPNGTRGMPNPTSLMTLPVLLNMLNTVNLRLYSGQPSARLQATLTYLSFEGKNIQPYLALVVSIASWIYWGFLPAFSYALVFAAYAAFPVAERLGGARDVQLMTGMSGCFFVFTHLAFDMICYALTMVPWCLIHFWFSGYSGTMLAAMIVSFMTFGPAAICIGYLMAERAESVGGAVSSMVLLFYVGGFMSVVVYGFLNTILLNSMPRAPFMLFPPYALIACLVKISQMEENANACAQLHAASQQGSLRQAAALSFWARAGHGIPRHEVVADVLDDFFAPYKPQCSVTTPFSFAESGIFRDLLFFLADGLLSFFIMSFLVSGYFLWGTTFLPGGQQRSDESDVEQERMLVQWLCQTRNFVSHALVASNLHKRFSEVYAVRGVSLALRPAECFGLLGVNGAGKTTTFEMLAGLTKVSFGDAFMMNARLSDNLRAWQSNISYCFQSGGLLDRMNAHEYLYLIGRLRGIPETQLKLAVDSVISVVDLQQHASKECGLYSGGNRRKLAIGAALLGLRPVVCLDEPFAGVDVVSRAKICRAISTIRLHSRTAFMLTSHNMDECEASCDRLTIMGKGKMLCLGTLQHLREKHGKGYRLQFMLKHGAGSDADRFVEAVPNLFPGITPTERHENVFGYHLVDRLLWSELFTRVLSLEKDFTLEYAIIGDNTLEHIFIAFAKAQEAAQKAV